MKFNLSYGKYIYINTSYLLQPEQNLENNEIITSVTNVKLKSLEHLPLNYSDYLEIFYNPPSQEQKLLQMGNTSILQLGVRLGEKFL